MPRVTTPAAEAPGRNIHRLRVAARLSMRRLAELCDHELDHTTIRRLERNEGFTQDTLERVAKVLGVQLQELFLPDELQDWPSLSEKNRARIAETIRDAVTAQRFNRAG